MTEIDLRSRLSRRRVVQMAALPAMAGGIAGCASSSEGGIKIAPALAGYQPTPKGAERCDNCRLWQPPASCRNVSGAISPEGWCRLWVKV